MNPALEFLLRTLAALALISAFVWGLHWLRADDPAAAVQLGQVSPADDALHHAPPSGPLPDLIASACQNCRHILTTDQRWLPPALVPLPPGCRVSHGLCPTCERLARLELDRQFPAPARTASPLVPVSAG